MEFTDIVKTVAPWIGTALGGPLGGMAVEALGNAMGLETKTIDSVKQAIAGATPEQMLALKQADQNFALQMQKLGFDHYDKLAELDVKDMDSARNREIQTKDGTNTVLAYTIVGAFIAMVGSVLLGASKVDSVLAGTLVGYLSAKCEQVLAYYFGSSRSSDRKTEILAQQNTPPVKNGK